MLRPSLLLPPDPPVARAPLSREAIVQEMLAAVRLERDAVSLRLSRLGELSSAPVAAGLRLLAEPGAFHYAFRCEFDVLLPEGTRVQLRLPGLTIPGEVLDHDPGGDRIALLLSMDPGASTSGILDFESTLLLDLLAARLSGIARALEPEPPADAVVTPQEVARAFRFLAGDAAPRPAEPVRHPGLAPAQQEAVGRALAQDVTYLWGPPGTGKTRAVGHLVHELVRRGERVLLTAHTNMAVDNALQRALELGPFAGGASSGAVLRVGYPAEGLRRFDVGLDEQTDRALRREQPSEAREMDAVCEELAELLPVHHATLASSAPLGRRIRLAAALCGGVKDGSDVLARRIAELSQTVEAMEQKLVNAAPVVATTLTRIHTSRLFRHFRCDALVVDETSIASLVHSFIAACCASRRAIAVGDFMQLPAIVASDDPAARKWLGSHVFNSAGCDRPERDHPLRAMLHEQFRMHPRISAVVSRQFYGGRLLDAPARVASASAHPSLLLLDTRRLQPRSLKTGSNSKHNPVHAALVADLVLLAGMEDIAVIAPYRAQVRAIREAIRARSPGALRSGRVEVSTVHRFQGRDKATVIFDLTESPGTGCRFFDEHRNPDAPNLVNVALSRARERLVLVGNLKHLAERLGHSAMLNRVIARIRLADGWELEAGEPRDEAQLAGFFAVDALPAAGAPALPGTR